MWFLSYDLSSIVSLEWGDADGSGPRQPQPPTVTDPGTSFISIPFLSFSNQSVNHDLL